MDLPEIALVNVLARFPLKSIASFRSISKHWKALLDSNFFRDYYISFNSTSSVSWSIIQTKPHKLSFELVSHHGCQTWGLTRSPGSYLRFLVETPITRLLVLSCTDGLVLLYVEEARNESPLYYIGNPLFEEWFRIPLPDFISLQDLVRLKKTERLTDAGLVTKIENGIVVSYKIVSILRIDVAPSMLEFMIYESETGIWITKNVSCSSLCPTVWSRVAKSITLNGILHWLSQDNDANDASSIVAYDFYGGGWDGDECRVISFPSQDDQFRRFRRTFTTSEGLIVYFNEFREFYGNLKLRVWKLVKYANSPEAWQLSWELNLAALLKVYIHNDYFPVVMHPLRSEIIYFWNRNMRELLLVNLRTHQFSFHKETAYDGNKCMDSCDLSFHSCKDYMVLTYGSYIEKMHQSLPNHLFFAQFVLPRWFYRLPRPLPT